ncbi:MAG: AMP-binding protein [Deltaproteobacteria bacterium]|nr:AMP-binding protein [Deltaproteobacteria bacterium]
MDLRSFTLYDIFKRNARVFKNRIAIQSEDRQITFGELHDQVSAVSGWLAAKGIHRGDRIAVLTKNRPEFFSLIGAVASLGAIVVPINFRLSGEEIRHILTDTRPELFFFETDFEKMVPDLFAGGASPRELIVFGRSGQSFTPFDTLLNHPAGKAVAVGDGDPLMIIHTAAIQGKPRGALLSHRGLVACSIHTLSALSLTYDDAYLNILPLFHIAGLMASLTMMQAGGRNVLASRYDPKAAGKTIDREKVTFIGNFPPILGQLLEAQAAGECSLSSLKNVIGVELPETVKRFEGLGAGRFWLAYGQTETMGLTCMSPNTERPGSAGRPGPLVDMKIVDEFDRECAAGTPGEIVIRGPLVFEGYWEDAELTQQTLRGGWHHTGDIGRLDEEGFLWFVGRKAEKELIKPGGENVYPVEVEKVIMEHPGIREVSVIGVPDPKFGEGIKAVCVLNPGARLSERELIDFVAGRIARYKKPGYVAFVDTLPKKEDGSIDRQMVKAQYGSANG